EWVKKAWNQVDSHLIMQSFKCCGIFTASDSSKKSVMFDYNWVNNSESQSKNSDYIYSNVNSASDNKSIIDLT
ncbi:20878_t:CDS:1, partial [Cetraspora pellucida]